MSTNRTSTTANAGPSGLINDMSIAAINYKNQVNMNSHIGNQKLAYGQLLFDMKYKGVDLKKKRQF